MPAQLHHFVPRFHLRQFVDSSQKRELIWVYERKKPTPELRSLDHVAAQKDYYAVKARDGEKLQHIEEILARVEGLTAPILRRLIDGERRISKDDRSTISMFLSFGCLRTPKFRGTVADLVRESVESFTRQLTSDPAKFAATRVVMTFTSSVRFEATGSRDSSMCRDEFPGLTDAGSR